MMLLAVSAWAYDSETQDVLLEDTAELFTAAEISTGYIPADSPLQVEFRVEAVGGAAVSMEGWGDTSWPDALTLLYTGDAESGIYLLDTSLHAITTIAVDLSDYGIYWTQEVDNRELTAADGTTFFDPFVLDTRVEVSDTTDTVQLITYEYEIALGVSLEFSTDMSPVVTAGFEGVQWTANEATITTENEPASLAPERVADFEVTGVYTAAWDATLDIVFTPTLEVCGPIFGCVEVVSFDYPFELVTEQFEQDFPEGTQWFPMPLLEPGVTSADFGEVAIGTIGDVQVPLANDGSMEAYGTATIEGSTDFTVYPPTFNALPGTEDGVVVTFAPTIDGEQSATLVLTSNDPSYPELSIPLTGNTPAATDEGGVDTGEAEKVSVSTCGCSGMSGLPASAGLLLALAGLAARRRPGQPCT